MHLQQLKSLYKKSKGEGSHLKITYTRSCSTLFFLALLQVKPLIDEYFLLFFFKKEQLTFHPIIDFFPLISKHFLPLLLFTPSLSVCPALD